MGLVISLLIQLIDLYCLLIFVYVIMSWIPTPKGLLAEINSVLSRLCDPYLDVFRRLIPPIGGVVDITPIIALLVLQLAMRLLAGGIYVIY